MRKILIIIMSIMMAFTLISCAQQENDEAAAIQNDNVIIISQVEFDKSYILDEGYQLRILDGKYDKYLELSKSEYQDFYDNCRLDNIEDIKMGHVKMNTDADNYEYCWFIFEIPISTLRFLEYGYQKVWLRYSFRYNHNLFLKSLEKKYKI